MAINIAFKLLKIISGRGARNRKRVPQMMKSGFCMSTEREKDSGYLKMKN